MGEICYYLLYVDDMILGTPNRTIMADLKKNIHSKFSIKDQGTIYFWLNMFFIRDGEARTIKVHQQSRIENHVSDLKLENTPPVKLPADPNTMLSKDQCPETPADIAEMESIPYKSIVGRLLYISITARPDISPAVSQVGRFCHSPELAHWEAVIRIILYLKGTQNLSLKLGGKHNKIKIAAYTDADWAGEIDTRRSRAGYTIFKNDSLVIWCSKLQISVATLLLSPQQ
jgi:hypothetical protein